MRHPARIILLAISVLSLGWTIFAAVQLFSSDVPRYFVAHSSERANARLTQEVARLTPRRVEGILRAELATEPRNWLVIDAIMAEVDRAELPLSSATLETIDDAHSADHGPIKAMARCGQCAFDRSTCALENLAICGFAVEITPIGDISDLMRALIDMARGEPVDRINVTLATLGLGSTAALVVTGGSSGTVKAGAALAKTARKMGRVPNWLSAHFTKAVRDGFDWGEIRTDQGLSGVRRAMNADALRPTGKALGDLGRLRKAVGIPSALYLLSKTKSARGLTRIADISEVAEDRTLGLTELVSKNRLLRATLRYSDELISVLIGVFGLLGSLLVLGLSLFGNTVLAVLRMTTRETPSSDC